MRVVARPEELVLADVRHQRGDSALVRVRRDEALPLEVVRRLLLQAHGGTERGPGERRVGTVEEVADPARLRLEHDDAQAREALEDTELEEGGKRLLHALAGEEIEVPDGPAELVEAMVDVERERLERGMHRERHVEVLRRREDGVVARIAVGHAGDGERTDEGTAAAVLHRALELEQLGLPQEAQRGIEHSLGHALAVKELHALLHVHGAERRSPKVRLLRRGTDPADLLGCDLSAHRALAELPRLVDALAHPPEGAELPLPSDRGALAVDL